MQAMTHCRHAGWLATFLSVCVFPAAAEEVHVVLDTALGEIEVAVDTGRAPVSAGDFLAYVDQGLYAGASFYRTVMPENDNGTPAISVIQGGVQDPARTLPPVRHETTAETGLRHEDGVISLARTEPGSGGGSAFFICIGDQPSLDFGGMRNPDGQGFAAFGRVVRGMDVVHAIHGQAADAESDSAYTAGQILTTPVTILGARRKAESGDGT
ncbi:MAG: peptidylprolyl isomerase [Woeseiaceae bacterium]|nr:peptidylprolyl isomerase [Woeseiaceae bacterium]